MKFTSERERILEPLQAVIGVVERRQTMPILANVLLSAKNGRIAITATDLEVELVAGGEVTVQTAGDITVPGRKFLDIVRALPEKSNVTFSLEGDKVIVRSGKSRFTLTTLPATDFPAVEEINAQLAFDIDQPGLRGLLEKTHFSMAQQDVRYYLNGMLLESDGKMLRTVATDGHRLALSEIELALKPGIHQVIIPRKGVLELQRLIGNEGVAAVHGAAIIQVEKAFLRIERASVGRTRVTVRPKLAGSTAAELHEIGGQFLNELLHQSLRMEVADKTDKLRELVIGKAIMSAEQGAGSGGGVSFSEDPLGIARPWEETYLGESTPSASQSAGTKGDQT
jgi:hypothetical protein